MRRHLNGLRHDHSAPPPAKAATAARSSTRVGAQRTSRGASRRRGGRRRTCLAGFALCAAIAATVQASSAGAVLGEAFRSVEPRAQAVNVGAQDSNDETLTGASDDSGEPRLDLVDQTIGDHSSPPSLRVRILNAADPVTLRARLYAAVSGRAELVAATVGAPTVPLIEQWELDPDAVDRARLSGGLLTVRAPEELVAEEAPPQDSEPATDEGGASAQVAYRGGVHPLVLELVGEDSRVLGSLNTLLTVVGGEPGRVNVAVVFDLRLPPAHTPGGGTDFDPDVLADVDRTAAAVADAGVHAAVSLNAETLDALELSGDTSTSSRLSESLRNTELLSSTWTTLDANSLVAAGESDIVVDGLRRAATTFNLAEATTVPLMLLDEPPTPQAVSVFTAPPGRVTGFVLAAPAEPAASTDPGETGGLQAGGDSAPSPVMQVRDAAGGLYPVVIADPVLTRLLTQLADPDVGVHHLLAELDRLAATSPAGVYVAMHAPHPDAAARLLRELQSRPWLHPVSPQAVITDNEPSGVLAQPEAGPSAVPPDAVLPQPGLTGYLVERALVESRLAAYESFVGSNTTRTPPLHTLLALSAARPLTASQRFGFLGATDAQITAGTQGIELIEADRITAVERDIDLPITVHSTQPTPVNVALELAGPPPDAAGLGISFPHGERLSFTLQPGRNHLLVPISASGSGSAAVQVAMVAPHTGARMLLAESRQEVRFLNLAGAASVIGVIAAVALVLWWLRFAYSHHKSTSGRPPGRQPKEQT